MANDQEYFSPDQPGASVPDGPLQPARFASSTQTRMLGIGLIALVLLLAYLFLLLWDSGFPVGNDAENSKQEVCVLPIICVQPTAGVRMMMVVMLAGALGSFIHTATSFGDFVGNKRLTTNWIWWYILKPFIGMALAAVFYLMVRGGLLANGGQTGNINPYGMTALAGLVGMFSKQATDKLSEVFDTMFKTTSGGGDAKRKEALDNPVPSLTKIDPSSIEPGSQNLILALSGSSFVSGSVVRINGSNRDTMFKDHSQLTATLQADDLAHEGQLDVRVFNPPPGGGQSAPMTVKIAMPARLPPSASMADPGLNEEHVDGCSVDITSPTPDEDLPPSRGGVAQ